MSIGARTHGDDDASSTGVDKLAVVRSLRVTRFTIDEYLNEIGAEPTPDAAQQVRDAQADAGELARRVLRDGF
jgi:hypothetical protein